MQMSIQKACRQCQCRYVPDSPVARGEATRNVPFTADEGSLEAALREALQRAGGTVLASVNA